MSIAEKLQSIAENMESVYGSAYLRGRDKGYYEGYEKGHSDGVESATGPAFTAGYDRGVEYEHGRFWDAFQQNGNRYNYTRAFATECWTDEIFKPKYDIRITAGYGTQTFQGSGLVNLKGKLEESGVVLNTSGCTNFLQFTQSAQITHLPTIDLTTASSTGYAFSGARTQYIEKLIVSENTAFQSTTFSYEGNLTDITVEGTIGTSINFQWSPLTVESMKSVISALKNFTGTGSEYSCTVNFSKACWAALEADSTAPDGGTWENYVISTLSWNT